MVIYPPLNVEKWEGFYMRTMSRLFWGLDLWDRMTWWHLAEIYVMPDGRIAPTWEHRRLLGNAVQLLDRLDNSPDEAFRSELRARGYPNEIDRWNLSGIEPPDPRRVMYLVS